MYAADRKPDIQSAQAVLQRLLPSLSEQIALQVAPRKDGRDAFRISSDQGRLKVAGSSTSAALFGVNWYLKYVAHLQISPNGSQLAVHGKLPLPTAVIEKETPYPYRYALNQNTDGYTTPYWTWTRWQHEIDVLAVSGINAMLVERGTDMVLYQPSAISAIRTRRYATGSPSPHIRTGSSWETCAASTSQFPSRFWKSAHNQLSR